MGFVSVSRLAFASFLGLAVLGALGCSDDGDSPPGSDRCREPGSTVCACPDGLLSCTRPGGDCECEEEPETPAVEIEVTDENRFIQEDLDAFTAAHPDVLSTEGAERMRTCVGETCLEEADESVDAFDDEGSFHLVPLWFRACMSGSGLGCLRAAQTFNAAWGTDSPIHQHLSDEVLNNKTMRYATRACELDSTQCRMWASRILSEPDSTDADVTRAVAWLQQECDDGQHHGCGLLGSRSNRGPHGDAIGDARAWFERACGIDVDPNANPYCDDYARILFASRSRADRREAVRIMEPICAVPGQFWTHNCEGELENGSLECGSLKIRFGASCASYAETLPPQDALPVFTALCRTVAVGEENVTENRRLCQKAERLARRLRRPAEYIRNLRTRPCSIDETNCWVDQRRDRDECRALYNECVDGRDVF